MTLTTDTARMPGDRRKRGARYVQLSDPLAQERLVHAAATIYRRMEKRGDWEAPLPVTLLRRGAPSTAPAAPARRGLFGSRRARASATADAATVTLLMPSPVCHAWNLIGHLPARLVTLSACEEPVRLASALAAVAPTLVETLGEVPEADRRTHAAYRALVQIAAELEALGDALPELPWCVGTAACVGPVRLHTAATVGAGRRADDPVLRMVLEQLNLL